MSANAVETLELATSAGPGLRVRVERPGRRPVADWALCMDDLERDAYALRRIREALADRNVGLVRVEAGSADVSFDARVEALLAAADRLRRAGRGPRVLIGHGVGGAAVLAAAGEIPEAIAVAVIAAPSDPGYLRRQLGDDVESEPDIGPQAIPRALLDAIELRDLPSRVRGLKPALLVLHAPLDRIVSIEHARRLFDAARQPKSFVSLDGADHALTQTADADYVATMLAAWVGRYAAAPVPSEAPAAGEVQVCENGLGVYANDVCVGRHRLTADEPLDHGGDDTGAAPYDYLLAALGACTSITLRMYAARKGLPLDAVAVRLRHRQVHAEDCADCEHREGRIELIERRIRLDGELTPEQRARLLEIADRCPVHRTLTGPIEIHSREEHE